MMKQSALTTIIPVSDEQAAPLRQLLTAVDRQFEFVQNQWANNPKFGGLYDDPAPLIDVIDKADGSACTFTTQGQPVRHRHSGILRFVEMRGGAYFFLFGIAAIRMLAELKQ